MLEGHGPPTVKKDKKNKVVVPKDGEITPSVMNLFKMDTCQLQPKL